MGRTRGRDVARLGVGATLALTLAGCWWPQAGGTADRRGANPAEEEITAQTVGDLAAVWSAPTDGPAGDPVTSIAGVHVDGTDEVYGFRTDGTPRWTVGIPGGWASIADFTSVLVDGDRVIAVHEGDEGTEFYQDANAGLEIDARTGVAGGATILAEAGRGHLLAGTHSRYLDGFHGEYLQVLDTATGDVESGLLALGQNYAALPPSHVTVGADAIFQTGPGLSPDSARWATNGVRAFPLADIPATCGPPYASAFSCATWITVIDAEVVHPAVIGSDQGTLYVAADSTVYALDAADGTILWSAGLPSAAGASPALADGRLYVPTVGGDLVVIQAEACGDDHAGCGALWSYAAGAPLTTQPAVAASGAQAVVFVGDGSGVLHAVEGAGCGSATCPALWSASVGAAVTGAPAISNGQVYVGTDDGLVALGL